MWTDDDVLVDPSWLTEYCAAAERWPSATYFGGRILPWYECPPPAWVENNLSFLKGVLLVRDLGAEERPFRGTEEPSGASMMFRRDVFEHLIALSPGYFDAARTGELTSRLTADTTQIKSAVGASVSA